MCEQQLAGFKEHRKSRTVVDCIMDFRVGVSHLDQGGFLSSCVGVEKIWEAPSDPVSNSWPSRFSVSMTTYDPHSGFRRGALSSVDRRFNTLGYC